jgi:hypothetical protein
MTFGMRLACRGMVGLSLWLGRGLGVVGRALSTAIGDGQGHRGQC